MSVDELIASRKLMVFVGPGGVGKTTVAAAVALRAAEAGRRTLVLTIDPARRLADALGLDGLDDTVKEVPTAGRLGDKGGSLHAAMFDNAVSMDALMARVAGNPEARDRILQNRVYRAMAGSLARSHAYLAMERLHELVESGDYDLVILDTPPARNALDILDAPNRLASFLDESVVRWFIRGREKKGIRGKLLATGGAAATKLFGVIAGREFLDETVAFFDAFYELREGFRERAERVTAILRESSTAFVLVSSADETHIEDARALALGIGDRGIPVEAVVFNRSYEALAHDPLELRTQAAPLDASAASGHFPDAGEAEARALVERLSKVCDEAAADNARGLSAMEDLRTHLPRACAATYVARLSGDVRDLEGLAQMGPYLAVTH